MGKEVEDYIDDLVIKPKYSEDHLKRLERVFLRYQKYNLKMNPKKCEFGVSSGKLFGFIVHHKGIDVDPAKTQSIISTTLPKMVRELKGLVDKLSHIRIFIPGLVALTSTFTLLLKKGVKFQ